MEKNFLKFFLLLFTCFKFVHANDSIYTVKDNKIFLQNEGNVLELREQAKKIAFEKAFNIVTKKILESSELRKLDRLEKIDISSLIKDFKIVEEKITDTNYSSNISVNFNSDSILNFFRNQKIKSKILVSEEYLVFPVFKKFNTFFLWENDNYWYESLFDEYDELGLLKLYFPKKNHINKLRISPKQILTEDSNSINNFLKLHNKKKAIIIYLEENYDLNQNRLKSKVSVNLFSKDNYETIKLFNNYEYSELSELSNMKFISKIVINELQNWWKNKIDSYDFESAKENVFFLKLKTKDLKKNILIEQRINEILGKKSLILFEFDKKKIIYKITTNFSIEKLNLALESSNLKFYKLEYQDNFFGLESY